MVARPTLRNFHKLSPLTTRFSLSSGSTLTEVLVALLIMSIGIVSLTTMFPLSVLRSIKASQLTHAADLSYNARAFFQDDDSPRGDMVDRARNDLWGVNAAPNNIAANQRNPNGFVIDPIGYHEITGNAPFFGSLSAPLAAGDVRLPIRHHGGTDDDFDPTNGATATKLERARLLATLPDSWVTQFTLRDLNSSQAGALNYTATGLLASGFQMPTSGSARIVFIASNDNAIQVRTIANVAAGDVVTWGQEPLPTPFVPREVRIETQEFRYSWLITVHTDLGGGIIGRDVVVFFRRAYSGDTNEDIAGNQVYPLITNFGFRKNIRTITVNPAGPPAAFIKTGNFVFDADNVQWYRIRGIAPSGSNIQVVLDRPAVADSPTNGKVIFPRAVVDVFPQ